MPLAASASAASPFRVIPRVILNNSCKAEALIDCSGKDKSFISEKLVNTLSIKMVKLKKVIG